MLSGGFLCKHKKEKILMLEFLCDSRALEDAKVITNSVTFELKLAE